MIRISLLLLVGLASAATAAEEVMDREIDYLLDTVAASDCVFVRNGKEHPPAAARDHLTLKRRKGRKYFSSAEEFIDRLASSSSWSGKPYHIRCGQEDSLAKDWFTAALQDYREQSRQGRATTTPDG